MNECWLTNPLLISPTSAMLRNAWRWGFSVQNMLRESQPYPFQDKNLLFGSDFAGDHKSSRYIAYGFLIAETLPLRWKTETQNVRNAYLKNRRRMAFKRLDDPFRQQALVPFLQAADLLSGHLVCILVDKKIRYLTTGKGIYRQLKESLRLCGKWNDRSFEGMARKAHIFALCLSQWSTPGAHVTWISDQDEFVANDRRLDDAQRFAAILSSYYSIHRHGIFAMNTTAIDGDDRLFEDFVAIPDLAVGMLSELCTKLSRNSSWYEIGKYPLEEPLTWKSEAIMDWFWYLDASLKRTCLAIDKLGDQMRVIKLDRDSI